MKHRILLLLALLLALSPAVSAQAYDEEHFDESFSLNKPLDNGKSYHYTASGRIDFKPGFSYRPGKGKRADFEVDPMMVIPPTNGMTGGPIAGDGGVVGSIGGSVNVSALGGAVYTIPIQVLPGKDGMQPTLGVTYNSQSGNGLLGYGWSLTGLSSVTRCGRTIYHDNMITGDAVDYEDDRFMLDGQRLLSISSGKTYGQDGCEYRTEVDNISRIISYGGDGQNPLSFKVWTKDGHIIEYGNTTDSRLIHPGGGEVAMWMVNKISDYNGNYIDYVYTTTGESCRIDHIDYTGSDNVSPMYSVTFSYEGRDDKEFAYLYNQRIVSDVLLNGISVNYKSTGEELCKYSFTYDNLNPSEGRFYSRLTSVGLEHDGVSVNPTTIEWGGLEQYCDHESITDSMYYFRSVSYVGDYNGDGIDDIASFPRINTGSDYWGCLYGNGDGTFSQGNLRSTKINGKYIERVIPCDLNGDGLCDLIAIYNEEVENDKNGPATGIKTAVYAYIADADGKGFTNMFVSDYLNPISIRCCVQVGDYLGDGKSEILLLSYADDKGDTSGTYFTMYTYESDEFMPIFHGLDVNRNCDDLVQGDFNGDGKTDVMIMDNTGSSLFSFKNENGYHVDMIRESEFPSTNFKAFSGDFNGDGKTDLLTWTKDEPWRIMFSTSDGFEIHDMCTDMNFPGNEPEESMPSLYGHDNDDDDRYCVEIGDVDGDGKSDVILVYVDEISVCYSPIILENDGTCSFIRKRNNYKNGVGYYYYNFNYLGDFYGKGYNSILLRADVSDRLFYIGSFNNQHKQNTVQSITDGMGNTVSFDYDYFTNPEFYTISEGDRFVSETDRVRRQALSLKALRSMTATNVSGTPVTSTYSYEDLCIHMTGRGLLGFMKSTVTDLTNGIKTVSSNIYSNETDGARLPFILPESSTTYLIDNSGGKIINTTSSVNKLRIGNWPINSTQPVVVETDKTIARNYDLNGDHTSSEIVENEYELNGDWYLYNNIINVKKGCTENGSCTEADDCPFLDENEIIYEPAITDSDNLLVSRVKKSTTIHMLDHDRDSIIKNSVEYTYNDEHPHLPKTAQTNPGDNPGSKLAVKTEYGYTFAGGNISKVVTTTSAPNDSETAPRTSTVEYGPEYQYRFATKTTDALGHSATATYDPVYGRRLSDTDCNGLTDEYIADFFGIDSESVSPDGMITHSSKRWCDGCDHAPAGALYYTWSKSSGSYPAMTFYHKTGVPLRSVTHGFDGEVIYVDMEYDAKGNLWRQSLPYKAGGSADGYTVYTYDALNRVKRTDYPDGTWDEVTYSGNEVAATHHDASDKLSQTVTKKYHPNGWLESTTDADNNTVSYVYNSDGTLESASAGGQDMAVTLTYNEAGMRKSIDDPDYGLMSYEYNAFGEVTKQTTPKGTVTSFEYDRLGRQTRRSVKSAGNPEETTVWTYSSEEGHVGTLENVVFNDLQRIVYHYDDMQRVDRTEETFDGATYESSCTYDKFGRPATETYPSGVTVSNRYNDGGYLYAVKDNGGDILWKADGHDIHGHLTDFHTGNGLATHHEYDDRTGRLLGITTRSEKNIFQDYTYTYDDFGNFASRRKNTGKMPLDTFTYDNLNRLTVVETNGVPFEIRYDSHGRILSKEQDGFSYGNVSFSNDHPHAVSHVEADGKPAFGGQSVTYTHFDKVATVTMDRNSLRIEYGHDRRRIRMKEDIDGKKRVKTYVGNCEFVHSDTGGDYVLTYLYAFGLINMNGRVYDPLMSSFLSPDNFIQSPENSQNFNRYAYCLNNPLRYTDPSGEVFTELLVMAAICATINVTMNGICNTMNDKPFFSGAGKAAIVGALAGATGVGVAALGASGALAGLAGGAVAGGMNAALNGSNVIVGMALGGLSGAIGGGLAMYIGGGIGAFVGGCASNAAAQIYPVACGEKFSWGQMLISGAFSCGMYYGTSFVNWKWRGGDKMGDVDVSFRQFNRMQTLFQQSRAWHREMGGYLKNDGSFKTSETGTNNAIKLGTPPEDAIASFHTHWDKPGKTWLVDKKGNYHFENLNGEYEKITIDRYHSTTDMENSGGIKSIVLNRYDGSYYDGVSYNSSMDYCFKSDFIGPLPHVYDIINPPVLRYNFGFLFSIKY